MVRILFSFALLLASLTHAADRQQKSAFPAALKKCRTDRW